MCAFNYSGCSGCQGANPTDRFAATRSGQRMSLEGRHRQIATRWTGRLGRGAPPTIECPVSAVQQPRAPRPGERPVVLAAAARATNLE